ncbi:two-component system, response regulator YesN [Thalassobacillus cyri]|uniref:Two-component system, response regulator YesN n=1 Tax=Thalassobacillus cyri TaxID=571932 RepID=A0A1H4ABI7_9BACI|nr:response regulator [Thalassobacillus cyri]SEA32904.1 two-component system, response regulator YesN [Thalassobacillus cyri]
MKKIFLLDDEVQVREGIKNSVDWANKGFDYCGDAPDGEVALPLIKKQQPDIVITDIKMPFMDGLELSRILREEMPDTKIIILSGHDEFEYAREAMRIQIADYCLKPISADELLKTLYKVSSQIDQEALEKKKMNELQNEATKNRTRYQETFLNEVCEGSFSPSDAVKKAAQLEVELIASFYYVLLLETESIPIDIIDSIQTDYPCLSFKSTKKEMVFIMKGETESRIHEERYEVKERLADKIKQDIERPILYGFGKVESRIHGISLSYSQAVEDKNYNKMVQRNKAQDSEENILHNDEMFISNRNELISFLKNGDPTEITAFAKSYTSLIEASNNSAAFFLYYSLIDFTLTIKQYLKEQEIEDVVLLKEMANREVLAGWIKEYSEVESYIADMLQLVMKSGIFSSGKVNPLIRKAQDYIQEHFNDSELSLQTVADKVNVSPSYFSRMFSKETGKTLVEYITSIRIEHAKKLLKSTNQRTYEIAQRVGYSDSHYFCNLFKKVTGMTTRQYKIRG